MDRETGIERDSEMEMVSPAGSNRWSAGAADVVGLSAHPRGGNGFKCAWRCACWSPQVIRNHQEKGCRGLEKVHQVIGNYLREKSHARQSVRGGCDDDSVRM